MSAIEDKKAYGKAMMSGDVYRCLQIERKYELDGYSPELVGIGLNAAINGLCPLIAVDEYISKGGTQ